MLLQGSGVLFVNGCDVNTLTASMVVPAWTVPTMKTSTARIKELSSTGGNGGESLLLNFMSFSKEWDSNNMTFLHDDAHNEDLFGDHSKIEITVPCLLPGLEYIDKSGVVLTRLATKDDAADATPKGKNKDNESLMLSPKVNATTAIAAMSQGKKSQAPTDILPPKIAQTLRRLSV